MVDKSKKRKKATISEQDVLIILERYTPQTILTLLHEVAQVAAEKIDWPALVKSTATGISSAREYQMLWRHLAYRDALIDNIDSAAEPLDDDSDLEFELEASPALSREASAEAAACVKVIMSSGIQSDSNAPNSSTIEAPLTINIPSANSTQGINICIPVSVQKQPVSSGTFGEKRPNSETSGATIPPRRKRRGWSNEEDMKLTAAVEKYGERNWANIARGDFKNDRKAQELSQRWANLRKKNGNIKVATSSQLSETQLAAAHRAMSLALDMPMGDSLKAARQISVGTNSHKKASASPPNQIFGTAGSQKLQVTRVQMNHAPGPDSLVKAAAVAAGARIASSADASSLMEAARSQNVVHIKTGSSSAAKASTTAISNQLPSNVHFIRNGLAKAPIYTISAAKPNVSQHGEAQQVQSQPTKLAAPASAAQPNPVVTATISVSPESIESTKTAENVVLSTTVTEMNERDQGAKEANIFGCAAVDETPVNQSNKSEEGVERHQSSSPGEGSVEKQSASRESLTSDKNDEADICNLKPQAETGENK